MALAPLLSGPDKDYRQPLTSSDPGFTGQSTIVLSPVVTFGAQLALVFVMKTRYTLCSCGQLC